MDVADRGKLPEIVSKVVGTKGSLPIVVFVDPALQEVYGAFGHAELKGQDYRAIFRDTKRKIRDAVKAGTFATDLAAPPAPKEEKGAVARKDVEEVDDVDRIEFEDSEISRWTSSKGTVLMARLVAIEDDTTYIFEKADGSEIRAEAQHLSDESVQQAREMAGR